MTGTYERSPIRSWLTLCPAPGIAFLPKILSWQNRHCLKNRVKKKFSICKSRILNSLADLIADSLQDLSLNIFEGWLEFCGRCGLICWSLRFFGLVFGTLTTIYLKSKFVIYWHTKFGMWVYLQVSHFLVVFVDPTAIIIFVMIYFLV